MAKFQNFQRSDAKTLSTGAFLMKDATRLPTAVTQWGKMDHYLKVVPCEYRPFTKDKPSQEHAKSFCFNQKTYLCSHKN